MSLGVANCTKMNYASPQKPPQSFLEKDMFQNLGAVPVVICNPKPAGTAKSHQGLFTRQQSNLAIYVGFSELRAFFIAV